MKPFTSLIRFIESFTKRADIDALEQVFQLFMDMHQLGVISGFVIGGGIAVLHYTEAIVTDDLDIFLYLPGSTLANLGPAYRYLTALGARPEGEYIWILDFKVQLLGMDTIVEEGYKNRVNVPVNALQVPFLPLEYLVVEYFKLLRPKDVVKLRTIYALASNQVDERLVDRLVGQFELQDQRTHFERNLQ